MFIGQQAKNINYTLKKLIYVIVVKIRALSSLV